MTSSTAQAFWVARSFLAVSNGLNIIEHEHEQLYTPKTDIINQHKQLTMAKNLIDI